MNVKPPITTPAVVLDDQLLDQALRPKTFDEYIGQEKDKGQPESYDWRSPKAQ